MNSIKRSNTQENLFQHQLQLKRELYARKGLDTDHHQLQKSNKNCFLSRAIETDLKKKKKKRIKVRADDYQHCKSLQKLHSLTNERSKEIQQHIYEKAELHSKNEELKQKIINPTMRESELQREIYEKNIEIEALKNSLKKITQDYELKIEKMKTQIEGLKTTNKSIYSRGIENKSIDNRGIENKSIEQKGNTMQTYNDNIMRQSPSVSWNRNAVQNESLGTESNKMYSPQADTNVRVYSAEDNTKVLSNSKQTNIQNYNSSQVNYRPYNYPPAQLANHSPILPDSKQAKIVYPNQSLHIQNYTSYPNKYQTQNQIITKDSFSNRSTQIVYPEINNFAQIQPKYQIRQPNIIRIAANSSEKYSPKAQEHDQMQEIYKRYCIND